MEKIFWQVNWPSSSPPSFRYGQHSVQIWHILNKIKTWMSSRIISTSFRLWLKSCALAPNEPEKRGCRMRIWDLFIKIRDLFSTMRLKKQRVHLHPLHPLVWHLWLYFKANRRTINNFINPSQQSYLHFVYFNRNSRKNVT